MQQRSDFRPMSLSVFLPLAIKIIDILGEIHAAGIIHKDINPGNILVSLSVICSKLLFVFVFSSKSTVRT